MDHSDTPTASPRLASRTGLVFGALLAAVLVAGTLTVLALDEDPEALPVWRAAPAPVALPSAEPSPSPTPQTITMSATGDIIMGNAPGAIPPDGGRGFFDDVKDALAADLVMGNLEEPLTDDTGFAKCRPPSPASPSPGGTPPKPSGCHQFRAPPSYAAHLRDAGFDLLNLANNHGHDYGELGHTNTQRALERHGLAHTGDKDQISVVNVEGVRVAVLGFTSYYWTNSLVDLAQAKAVVKRAAKRADLVVVQVHMGAEGADATRVRPGTESFLGENRGDPIRFSHAVIDAGADLVVGHGPHVMRALEFYRGRLIAYSLGNFAGGAGTLGSNGNLGLGAVLKVSLRADGTWVDGALVSTTHQGGGLPRIDRDRRGLALVRSLCRSDFPTTSPELGRNGEITPRR
jgi:hypothetical protein